MVIVAGLTMGLKDDMWRLEAKGMESDVKERELASARQQNIMFVRGETQVNKNFPISCYLKKIIRP